MMHCVSRLSQSAVRSQANKLIVNFRNFAKSVKMSTTGENHRVLSIQSHVVHGYCGNKSAVFPLQVIYLSETFGDYHDF